MSWLPEWAEKSPRWYNVLMLHHGYLNGGVPEWVEDEMLAEAIREEPRIPDPELAELVAGRIDGSVSRPRGRPKDRGLPKELQRILRGFIDEMRVGIRQAGFKRQGIGSPKEQAIQAEAKAQHISPHTLKNRLREHRQASQKMRQSVAHRVLARHLLSGDDVRGDWSDFVEQRLADGEGRLDPERGFVWTDSGDRPLENPE